MNWSSATVIAILIELATFFVFLRLHSCHASSLVLGYIGRISRFQPPKHLTPASSPCSSDQAVGYSKNRKNKCNHVATLFASLLAHASIAPFSSTSSSRALFDVGNSIITGAAAASFEALPWVPTSSASL